MDTNHIVSLISVVLYSSLIFVAGYFSIRLNGLPLFSDYQNLSTARQTNHFYIEPKNLFFGVMIFASFCSLLPYLTCLIGDYRGDCVYSNGNALLVIGNSIGYIVGGVGYVYTVIVPCILWNDVLTLKDGKLFNSKHPPDRMKQFYRIVLFAKLISSILFTIANGLLPKNSKPESTNEIGFILYIISWYIEALMSTGICIACFVSAIQISRLVNRLYSVDRSTIASNNGSHSLCNKQPLFWRFLFPMFVIMTSYLIRAVFLVFLSISSFSEDFSVSYNNVSYLWWTLFAKWIPNVLCSYVLIGVVRRIGRRTIDEISDDGESEYGEIKIYFHSDEVPSLEEHLVD